MGRAMMLPASNSLLKSSSKLNTTRGPYTYTIQAHDNQSTYSVSDSSGTISLPIRWSFGAGVQAWIFEKDGHYIESLVSYYPATGGLDLTIGDEKLSPKTLQEAVGRELSPADLKECLECHATNAVSGNKLNLDSFQPGVACSHCHQGSDAHLLDAESGYFDSAPPSLRKKSAEDISNFCGQCHRTWETVVRNHWRGESNVRFAPYRLANSKCFDGADSRISCLACHDPHRDVVTDASWYDAKCLTCHSQRTSSPRIDSKAKPCKTAKSECVTCHMPKVKLPDENVTFTDHEIRVVHGGDPYPD